jgi:circadian clock protein KaiC
MNITPAVKCCSTGIEGLDEILQGGLPNDRIYLVQGLPGLGKTTLALQFLMEGVRRGESVLYITLSETRDELVGVAESHAWDLTGVHILELSAIERQLGEINENTFFHPSELELEKTSKILLDEVNRLKPTRLVLDSLSEFRLLAEAPLRYRRQMLKMKQYFAGRHSTVLLLDDRTTDQGDLHIQSIAHGVITLEKLAVTYGVQRRQLQVNKLRGIKFREGWHDYVIEKGGLKVFPRLVAATQAAVDFVQEPSPSGIPEFDKLLGGGLDRGTSNLFIGPAGCGKSTLAIHHAVVAAQRGEKCAIFAFDENHKTLQTRCKALGTPIEALIASGLIHIRQVDPAELSPGEFSGAIRDLVKKENVKLVIIDSLNGYLSAMPNDKFLSLHLHELVTFLSQKGVISILTVAQHGVIGTMQSPVDVTYLADTVLLLRYFEANGRVKKALSVIKKRSGVHEDSIRELRMNETGISVGPPLKEFRGILTGVPIVESTRETF